LGLAVAALVALALGSASASVGIRPPAGIPDLAKMALRTSDLPAGARVKRQGYVESSSVARYEREFVRSSVRVGGKRLLGVENDVLVEVSAEDAAAEFVQLRRILSSKSGRKALVDALDRGLDFKPDFVRVSAAYRFRAGEESVALTVTIGTFIGTFQVVIGFFRDDRVVTDIVLAGLPDARVPHADVTTLGRLVDGHMRAGLAPAASAPPVVTGTPTAGQHLTATIGTWTSNPTAFAYQWQRCDPAGGNCAAVTGATSQTYVLMDADAGSTLRVAVTATNRFGSVTAVSLPTAVIAPATGAPLNVGLPSISGSAAQGQTLTATTGVWVGSPTGFTYQWQRCDTGGANCVAIDGAAAATYVVTSADAGATLRVAVTATNASGSTTAVSAQTATVT
jgi:hypothetical protein